MTRTPSTRGSNLSDYLSCPHCNTQLPPQALFCRFCGKQVKQKQNGEPESDTELSDEAQEQETKTIRLAALPQIHLKRWLSYQSHKNNNDSALSQGSSPLQQDAEEVSTQPTSSSQEITSADETVLLVAPIQIERTQVSPIMPAPSIPEIQERAHIRANWLWPTIIMLSAIAAGLVNFVLPYTALRPITVFWFLFVCPGMVVVRFLRLKEPVVEWTLAVALSFAIEAVLAGIQLYAGKWSPTATLAILIGFCFIGSALQLAKTIPITSIKMYPIIKAMKRRTEKSVPLAEDSSPIEPPVLIVSEVSTKTQFAQHSLSGQNGRIDQDSPWPDMDIEMSFSQSDWEWSISSRRERDGQEE